MPKSSKQPSAAEKGAKYAADSRRVMGSWVSFLPALNAVLQAALPGSAFRWAYLLCAAGAYGAGKRAAAKKGSLDEDAHPRVDSRVLTWYGYQAIPRLQTWTPSSKTETSTRWSQESARPPPRQLRRPTEPNRFRKTPRSLLRWASFRPFPTSTRRSFCQPRPWAPLSEPREHASASSAGPRPCRAARAAPRG